MDTAAQILVIIVSSFLAIFLVLAIVLIVLVIRVTLKIKQVANQAEVAVDAVSKAATSMSKASTPFAIFNGVRSIVGDQVRKRKK